MTKENDDANANIRVHNEIDKEVWRIVDGGLSAYNAAAAPLDEVQPLACSATSEAGEVIGGVVGRTWGDCCEMLQLWVDESQRGKGVGRLLVEQFHQQAESRGCKTFYLDTFSFQAPEFYRKLGYEVKFELQGYTHNIVKYVMVRNV